MPSVKASASPEKNVKLLFRTIPLFSIVKQSDRKNIAQQCWVLVRTSKLEVLTVWHHPNKNHLTSMSGINPSMLSEELTWPSDLAQIEL